MAKKSSDQALPSAAQVADFERLTPLLEAAYKEIADLSKKNPGAFISKLKLELLDQILSPLRTILSLEVDAKFLPQLTEHAEEEYFGDPPSVSCSDALFVLGQYRGASAAFRSRFRFMPADEYSARWVTIERPGLPRN